MLPLHGFWLAIRLRVEGERVFTPRTSLCFKHMRCPGTLCIPPIQPPRDVQSPVGTHSLAAVSP